MCWRQGSFGGEGRPGRCKTLAPPTRPGRAWSIVPSLLTVEDVTSSPRGPFPSAGISSPPQAPSALSGEKALVSAGMGLAGCIPDPLPKSKAGEEGPGTLSPAGLGGKPGTPQTSPPKTRLVSRGDTSGSRAPSRSRLGRCRCVCGIL